VKRTLEGTLQNAAATRLLHREMKEQGKKTVEDRRNPKKKLVKSFTGPKSKSPRQKRGPAGKKNATEEGRREEKLSLR